MDSKVLRDLCEAYNEIYDDYIEEVWGNQRYPRTGPSLGSKVSKAFGFGGDTTKPRNLYGVPTSSGSKPSPRKLPSEATGVVDPKWEKGTPKTGVYKPVAKPTPRPAPTGSSSPQVSRPAISKPVSTPPTQAKTAPTPAPSSQTGDKSKDMQTWAKANPTLANKPQRTFNPLMQKTFGYQTGYSPSEVKGNIQKAKTMASLNAGFGWGSTSKLIDDIADVYSSIYEAKKKVDQDQDGDNDFADIRIARRIASGVPKEIAIAKVKGKPYNEEYNLDEETEEERKRNERRARIAELQAQGRVMTSAKRTSARAKERREEQKAEKLEKLANAALEATRGATRRSSKPMGSTQPEAKAAAPKANRRLSSTVKNDKLASRADELLRMLQNEDFQLWVQELLDEGYTLENWTDEELVSLYEEILEEKYGTAAGRKRVAKKTRAGKDIGKKGPGFQNMVDKLTPKYGKERATKITAAQMWKTHA